MSELLPSHRRRDPTRDGSKARQRHFNFVLARLDPLALRTARRSGSSQCPKRGGRIPPRRKHHLLTGNKRCRLCLGFANSDILTCAENFWPTSWSVVLCKNPPATVNPAFAKPSQRRLLSPLLQSSLRVAVVMGHTNLHMAPLPHIPRYPGLAGFPPWRPYFLHRSTIPRQQRDLSCPAWLRYLAVLAAPRARGGYKGLSAAAS